MIVGNVYTCYLKSTFGWSSSEADIEGRRGHKEYGITWNHGHRREWAGNKTESNMGPYALRGPLVAKWW